MTTRPLNVKYLLYPSNSTLTDFDIYFSQGNDEPISGFLSGWVQPFSIGTPNPSSNIFATTADAITYYAPTAIPAVVAEVNGFANNLYAYSGKLVNVLSTEDDRRLSALEAISPGGSRTQSSLTLSLVGTGATGTQIDVTHDALVSVTVSTSATASIAGAATSIVVLKICATNNATEASWTSVATQETDQNVSLAITLQSVTAQKGQLTSLVPAGWYVKLVNSGTGTHSEAFISGQKTIFS